MYSFIWQILLEHLLYATLSLYLEPWSLNKLERSSGPPSHSLHNSDKGNPSQVFKSLLWWKTDHLTKQSISELELIERSLLWETQICLSVTFYQVPNSIPQVPQTKSKPFKCWKPSNIWRPLLGFPQIIFTLIQTFSNPSAIPWLILSASLPDQFLLDLSQPLCISLKTCRPKPNTTTPSTVETLMFCVLEYRINMP